MLALSSQCFAIAQAHNAGSLRIVEREGRFGTFAAITDERGTIEVADTIADANARVASIRERLA